MIIQSSPSRKRFIDFDHLPDRDLLWEAIHLVQQSSHSNHLSEEDVDLFYEYVRKYSDFPAYSVIVSAKIEFRFNQLFRRYISRLLFFKEDDGSLKTRISREDHRHIFTAQGIKIRTGVRYKICSRNYGLLEVLEYA